MAQAYSVYTALIAAVGIALPEFIVWIYGAETRIQHVIGWMGFTCCIACIIGCLAAGLYIDRYAQHKLVAVVLNGGSAISWLLFSTVLNRIKNAYLLFIVIAVYGAMSIPYYASGLEQVAEMTFPVAVNTSSAVILMLSNLYGFIFIYVFGALIEHDYPWTTLHLILGLYVLLTALVGFAKMKLKRTKVETESK